MIPPSRQLKAAPQVIQVLARRGNLLYREMMILDRLAITLPYSLRTIMSAYCESIRTMLESGLSDDEIIETINPRT